jgi:hypothetical protein
MKLVIAGGTGHLGTLMARSFRAQGHSVTILTRGKSRDIRTLTWCPSQLGAWVQAVENADVVINLAGRSVNCRYTRANRKAILDSRVESTRAIGQVISNASTPPKVWLQASTATIYSHRFDAPNDEANGTMGGTEPGVPKAWRFSTDVAKAWEDAAHEHHLPETRIILMRMAMVMSPEPGGVFDTLLGLVRRGLGGALGSGKQYVSWIHEDDFLHALDWLISKSTMAGPVNICSPNPLPNKEFMEKLRLAWGTRFSLPATHLMLELGAFFMRTETELILKSRRVIPTRLKSEGFRFEFSDWEGAAADLVRRWREHRQLPLQ